MNTAEQNISAECPNCQRAYVIENLNKYLENKLALWRFILRQFVSGGNKQRLIGSLAISNAKATLIKEIEEDGGLIATCIPCIVHMLEKIFQSNKSDKPTKVEFIIK